MSESTSPSAQDDSVDPAARNRWANLLVRALTPGYERDVRERGRNAAYAPLRHRLDQLIARGALDAESARLVSHRVRYADLLARFAPEIVDRYRHGLRFAVGPEVHRGVPPGTYALPVVVRLHQGNDLAFYRVSNFGGDPAMAGYRLVKRQVGLGEEMVPRRQIAGVFQRIAKFGPEAAAKLWQGTIGACQACGSTLTNLSSRAAGEGWWCRQHRPGGNKAEQAAAERIAARRKLQVIDGGRA